MDSLEKRMRMTRKPNFIFIMTDEQNLRGLSCYQGTVCQTPTADRMAREGILFENAYCSYPVCMPSRAAFMTGRWPHVNGVRSNGIKLPEHEISLPQLFKGAGYSTALCGKDHLYCNKEVLSSLFDTCFTAMHSGVTSEIPDDFPAGAKEANRYYTDTLRPKVYNPFGHGVIPFPPEVCDAGLVTESALRFIRRETEKNSPFFMWLSYSGPHWPFTCPESYVDTVPPEAVDMPPADELATKPANQEATRRLLGLDKASEGDFRKIISLYYGNCRYIDDQIGRVFALLQELGIDEDTMVFFTTDHGDYLGEHGLMHKSVSVYDALMKIPWIWRWPGHIAPAQRCPEFMEGVDLAPTVLDLCGIETPDGVQGLSHAAALLGKDPFAPRETCFAECGIEGPPVQPQDLLEDQLPGSPYEEWALGPLGHQYWSNRVKMVRTKKWKLGYYSNGDGELYDMEVDRWELSNLYSSPEHRGIVADMKERLLQWMIETEDTLPVLGKGKKKGQNAASQT